jgi:hypothetical protein
MQWAGRASDLSEERGSASSQKNSAKRDVGNARRKTDDDVLYGLSDSTWPALQGMFPDTRLRCV